MARLARAGAEAPLVSAFARAPGFPLAALVASAVALVLVLGLSACSPPLNWRTVALGDIALELPCKPDHAQRQVTLGEQKLEMDMVGCEADGALFAVSRVVLPKALTTDQLQAHWQTATLQQMKTQGNPSVAPENPRHQAPSLKMLSAAGQTPDGRAVQARLAWAKAGAGLYHFAVYAPRITPEMAEPFFDGIKAR